MAPGQLRKYEPKNSSLCMDRITTACSVQAKYDKTWAEGAVNYTMPERQRQIIILSLYTLLYLRLIIKIKRFYVKESQG